MKWDVEVLLLACPHGSTWEQITAWANECNGQRMSSEDFLLKWIVLLELPVGLGA